MTVIPSKKARCSILWQVWSVISDPKEIKLVFDTGTSRLLGAQVAGMDAAHPIAPLALAVQQESTAEILAGVPFPHPRIAEGIIDRAARDFCP